MRKESGRHTPFEKPSQRFLFLQTLKGESKENRWLTHCLL